ncbi:hypothetical protein NL676_032952 [Syzygium grande]|nr:hypothetical protein NL676_032952 [Syzygium grande]
MSWSKDNTKQQGITVEADDRLMLTSRGGGAGTRHDQEELAAGTPLLSFFLCFLSVFVSDLVAVYEFPGPTKKNPFC